MAGGTLIIHLSKEEEQRFPVKFGFGGDEAQETDFEAAGGGLSRSDRRLYGGSLLLFFRVPANL